MALAAEELEPADQIGGPADQLQPCLVGVEVAERHAFQPGGFESGEVVLDVRVSPHRHVEGDGVAGLVGVVAPEAEVERREQRSLRTGVEWFASDDQPGPGRPVAEVDVFGHLAHRRAWPLVAAVGDRWCPRVGVVRGCWRSQCAARCCGELRRRTRCCVADSPIRTRGCSRPSRRAPSPGVAQCWDRRRRGDPPPPRQEAGRSRCPTPPARLSLRTVPTRVAEPEPIRERADRVQPDMGHHTRPGPLDRDVARAVTVHPSSAPSLRSSGTSQSPEKHSGRALVASQDSRVTSTRARSGLA